MDKSLLVRLFGFGATLIHGDTLVLDRWCFLERHLPIAGHGETLLDVGCGTGAFTIGAARRGYRALGLSWDERNQTTAAERARACGVANATFDVHDVRHLDRRRDLRGAFDIVVCFENAEHILDDAKLFRDIAACLKPGGRLLVTSPFLHHRAITPADDTALSTYEDGGHVRRGYTPAMLADLCAGAGLVVEEVAFCSGVLSQKITWLLRTLARVHPLLGWAVVLPLRIVPPLIDPALTRLLRWPYYSICVEAAKPNLHVAERAQR
ncbi:MAG TPA: class I SAM-dependent methyltransferase [Vicinamibacterales bacterium]|nr:class I SAM-dependent methyltransferase [Vicinamibacterales bacterium]